jgi:hypothetical protein
MAKDVSKLFKGTGGIGIPAKKSLDTVVDYQVLFDLVDEDAREGQKEHYSQNAVLENPLSPGSKKRVFRLLVGVVWELVYHG